MKIAHISDLHLLNLQGVGPLRFLNKRLTGYVNLRWRRHAIHRPSAARAVARAIRERSYDHVVVTGDLTNLALESEFETVRNFLAEDQAMSPEHVSIVPGNHDAYTRGAHRSRRFLSYLCDYTTSDLPDASALVSDEAFPFVRLRGPAAIIGLSSAVPRLPLVASGRLGRSQLMALRSILAHDEVRKRTVILLQHHPWHNPASRLKRTLNGLSDAEQAAQVLDVLDRGLLLHGHLHRRIRRQLRTTRGILDTVGSTSASLVHDDDDRMAGFNHYEIDDASGAITQVEAHRLDVGRGELSPIAIPTAA